MTAATGAACPNWCIVDKRSDPSCHPDDAATEHLGQARTIAATNDDGSVGQLVAGLNFVELHSRCAGYLGPKIKVSGDDGTDWWIIELSIDTTERLALQMLELVREGRA